jgi:hypothetical protein
MCLLPWAIAYGGELFRQAVFLSCRPSSLRGKEQLKLYMRFACVHSRNGLFRVSHGDRIFGG